MSEVILSVVHGSSCAVWFSQVSIPHNTVFFFWSYLDELPSVGDVPFAQEAVEDRVMRLAYCTVILARLVMQWRAKGEEDLFLYGFAICPVKRRSIPLSTLIVGRPRYTWHDRRTAELSLWLTVAIISVQLFYELTLKRV